MKNPGSNFNQLFKTLNVLVFLIFFAGVIVGISFGKGILWQSMALIVVVIMGIVFFNEFREFSYRFSGLEGEKKIGTLLQYLYRDGVRAVNDVFPQEKRGNIDHIAITKNGVWAIETKNTDGKITYEDNHLLRNKKIFIKNYLEQAYAEGKVVRDILIKNGWEDIPVRKLLIFANDFTKIRLGEKPIEGIYVIRSEWLGKTIQNRDLPTILSSKQIDELASLFSKYISEG